MLPAAERAGRCVNVVGDGVGVVPVRSPVDPVEDDAVLDGWIGSLTPEQFARVLHSLAGVDERRDGGPRDPER